MKFKSISIDERSANFYKLCIGLNRVYFSYETIIAFTTNDKLYICENAWRTTTGKHLNMINTDKSIRIKRDEFLQLLEQIDLT